MSASIPQIALVAVLAVLLAGVAVALMCVKIMFKKNGRFPSGHVHDSAALRERGIGCARRDL